MRLVSANTQTQPFKLDEGRCVRAVPGARGMTVTEVQGFGQQKGHTEICRATAHALSFVPTVRIELVAASEHADKVIAAIPNAARVGEFGDGISPIASLPHSDRAHKAAVQTFTDISSDEEGDHGSWNMRAPKTRISRGCSLGDRDCLSCIR